MRKRPKEPYLYFRKERRGRDGKLIASAGYVIRDGQREVRTGCGPDDHTEAVGALGEYCASRRVAAAAKGLRRADQIAVGDVIALYCEDVAVKQARPREALLRAERLVAFFGQMKLSDINGQLCRRYVEERGSEAAARRELEDLRAAINHHRTEGLCREVVSVWLPERSAGRERWLTRSEVARLLWAAWRYREVQNWRSTERFTRRHIARFILVALYTGSRAGVVTAASLGPSTGRGWIDLDRGVFYRRPEGAVETKKRRPAIRLPDRLLTHLRRWRRLGAHSAVEWNGQPVKSVRKAFAAVVRDAGLGPDVTPHVLRHTSVTWTMQNGGDRYEAGGYYGLSQEMIEDRYAHHHPDHQGSVVAAVVSKARPPHLPPHGERNEKRNVVDFGVEQARKTANA